MVIAGAFFTANRAAALDPFVWPRMDMDLQLLKGLPKVVDGNHFLFTTADIHAIVAEI